MNEAVTNLSWSQVCAWRLKGQFLLKRASTGELLDVVSRLGGVQAQLASAAEQALLARIEGFSRAEAGKALWEQRSLMKTWAMRGTLHLLNPADLALHVAARGAFQPRRPPSYYSYHGVTPEALEAILEGVPRALSERPMTREQLSVAVAEGAGMPDLREVLLSGWGALLKPSAFRGDLCFGPNQGQNVTFVRPDKWIGTWRADMDPQDAMREVARRYLRTYGPANPADFARWWGIEASRGKTVFKWLEEELTPVSVEGWKAWCLGETLEAIQSMDSPSSVRLLPQFDAYTLGTPRDNTYVIPEKHRTRIYRPQGWISAVVLVDGRMRGIWELKGKGELKVEMFDEMTEEIQGGIHQEVERLGKMDGAV